MSKTKKYCYRPDDNDCDYQIGNYYKGKVRRCILSQRKHPRAVEVTFPNGMVTTVHKKSFDISDTAIDFYHIGTPITLKKVGYIADHRTTKWVIIRGLKYDLYTPEGYKLMQEVKREREGVTNKYQPLPPAPQKSAPSIFAKLKGSILSALK